VIPRGQWSRESAPVGKLPASVESVLPNFLVIGAAKSGTTSLWAYLREHPDIFMAQRKELDFFCARDWRGRVDWYADQFAGAVAPLRGEASVYYSMHPFKPDVAAQVYELIPGARIIYLVRDPVPRILSHYVTNVANYREEKSLNEALADLTDPMNEYVCSSRYASQLREYLRFFPAERILVEDHAVLLSDRARALRRIFDFLGVDDGFRPRSVGEVMNTRNDLARGTPVGLRLRKSAAANAVRRLPAPVGAPLARAARRIFYRRVERHPTLSPDLRGRLAQVLRPDIQQLVDLTGLPLESWTIWREIRSHTQSTR
jgi:hypothetical protein